MTDQHKEQHQEQQHKEGLHQDPHKEHEELPQGQAYDSSRAMPHEGAPVSDPKKPKPVPMTAGTPPRPMSPNEIIASGRSSTTEPLQIEEPEEEESKTASKAEPSKKEK